jgi:hypothetical protein
VSVLLHMPTNEDTRSTRVEHSDRYTAFTDYSLFPAVVLYMLVSLGIVVSY